MNFIKYSGLIAFPGLLINNQPFMGNLQEK